MLAQRHARAGTAGLQTAGTTPAPLLLPPFDADGRYQVFVVAYNQFGYTRSAASNVVTVGTPSTTPLDVTASDGDGQIGISFASAVSGV